ncbi:DUF7266 family protein [Halogeometricum limi]|uniref:Uncharacterized protein n=1 Tax=Halogeometricum limi TaxID=555875 RepID=A0A1I6GQG5_9EURY|nr:hypothetical protein [Halogeometricum limi]SFR44428.1 hypothetical protein SAMN04488124_1397 [Halogeometricum limi]
MRPREGADRGVSTTLGYVLTLAITAILVSGLLVGTGQYVDDQRRQVSHEEMAVVGERIAGRTADVDRMVRAGEGVGTVRVRAELPPTIAGQSYRIEVSEPTVTTPRTHEITLTTTAGDSETVTVRTGVDIAEGSVSGGTVVIDYDPSTDRIGLESNESVSASLVGPDVAFAPSVVSQRGVSR